MSAQNKNLKFVLDSLEIILNKLTLFFEIFYFMLKLVKKLTNLSKVWALKKKKKYMFQNGHERIKDCLLIYHFL